MPYKCIAVDLDDTLLNAKKEITPTNMSALKKASETGVHIVLASGRTVQGMRFVLDQIPFRSYTISSGGAVVSDINGKEVYSCCLPPETAKKIMRYAHDHGYYFQIFCNNTFYYITRTGHTDNYEASVRFNGIKDPGILEWDAVYTTKILVIDTQERIDSLRALFEQMFPEIRIVYSQFGYMEIFNATVSKGNALNFIADRLHIGPGEIIAIGDSEIDISMIEYAGLGIAMENARKPVLKIADCVTASSEQDGVARVIEQFIFGEEL